MFSRNRSKKQRSLRILATELISYRRNQAITLIIPGENIFLRLATAKEPKLAACLIVGPWGVVAGVLAGVTALALPRWLMTLLPGLTGDCYGATCEVVETVVWLSGAVLLPRFG